MQLTRGFNHIAVLTDNLDRFVEFYTDIFDLDVVFSRDHPSVFGTQTRALGVGLVAASGRSDRSTNHGFRQPGNVPTAVTSTISHSPQTHPPPFAVAERAPQRPRAPPTARSKTSARSTRLWFTDPDGMRENSSSSSTHNSRASTPPHRYPQRDLKAHSQRHFVAPHSGRYVGDPPPVLAVGDDGVADVIGGR